MEKHDKFIADSGLTFDVQHNRLRSISSFENDDAPDQLVYDAVVRSKDKKPFHFIYHMGIGNAEGYAFKMRRTRDMRSKTYDTLNTGVNHFIGRNREILPTDADLFYSLLMDASCADGRTFEDFCYEYDYDSDSIKALEIYRACVKTLEFLSFGHSKNRINMEAALEAFEDY